ncbi:MAG: leucyl/phenylalanyl-tRNA--protein transferase, partial [Myxococcota bacterium]
MRERPQPARALRLIPPEWIADRVRAADFPDPAGADADGLMAYGGDLRPERLLTAYALGIFPWYESPPVLWYCPDPRALIPVGGLHINRSLARTLRRAHYTITFDTQFQQVIEACATVPRAGQSGTWIGRDMIR